METMFELNNVSVETFISWLRKHIIGLQHMAGWESIDGSPKYFIFDFQATPPSLEYSNWKFLVKVNKRIDKGKRKKFNILFHFQELSDDRIVVKITYPEACKDFLGDLLLAIPEKYRGKPEAIEIGQSIYGSENHQIVPLNTHLGVSLRKSGVPGRPHKEEDIWAWKQVNLENRDKADVFKEWKAKRKVQARNLVDAERQFKRVTQPNWYQNK